MENFIFPSGVERDRISLRNLKEQRDVEKPRVGIPDEPPKALQPFNKINVSVKKTSTELTVLFSELKIYIYCAFTQKQYLTKCKRQGLKNNKPYL